ncbi:hypothetical protein [Paenibacillus sp. HB172176]|uniref:hypothetical protein n=1 Tax=Paenibacillus sp. HB172176 TaxID=2493690 RepID=UPI001439FECE|nr:hypothetical protein [Paenibacillus sp. HB172176]
MHPFMGIEDWQRTGFSVEQSAKRLQRIAYADRQLMRVEAGHMTARPEYELKGALARMLWQDASHYDALRNRGKQLRMSVVAFDKCPDEALEELMSRVLDSPSTLMLLSALFEVVKPAQIAAIKEYLQLAQPIVDEPTIQMLRHQLLDREEQVQWGLSAIDEYRAAAGAEELQGCASWTAYMKALLDAAGGMSGQDARTPVPARAVVPAKPFALPELSTRDPRFTSAIIKHEGLTFEQNDDGRFLMMMYNRFFEMTAAEAIAYVHYTEIGRPWAFYYDTARHTWDEVRHSWFGEAALRLKGYDVYAAPNWTGWYHMTANLFEKDEAYTHLTIAIEKAAMKYPPGKREEWEFCRDTVADPLMTTFQDFDWADEVVHAGFGQRWVVEHLFEGDAVKAKEAGERTVEKRSEFMAASEAGLPPEGLSFGGGY